MHDYEVMRICVRAYLRAMARAQMKLDMIEEQMARLQARMALRGVDCSASGPTAPASPDKMPDALAALREVYDMWDAHYALTGREMARARLLCGPHYPNRHALWLHEVERMTWTAVAAALKVSERSARRMGEQGVRELYYAVPEQWRRDPIPNAEVR